MKCCVQKEQSCVNEGHTLRKFHANALYNDGRSLDKVNDLQGKAKNNTDEVYFMTNPEDLIYEYINIY